VEPSVERFRVFRLEGDVPVYVGTFAGANAKEAVKQGVYADEAGGPRTYEAHVLRNTSVFDVKSRDERFIDSVTQLNSQQHFAVTSV
jgi:hypothetical protein